MCDLCKERIKRRISLSSFRSGFSTDIYIFYVLINAKSIVDHVCSTNYQKFPIPCVCPVNIESTMPFLSPFYFWIPRTAKLRTAEKLVKCEL